MIKSFKKIITVSAFIMCLRVVHAQKTPDIIYNPSGFTNIGSDEVRLEMFLPKEKYVEYEPVIVMYRYINTGKDTIPVSVLFARYGECMWLNMTQNSGIPKNLEPRSFGTRVCKPVFILRPGDTLLAPYTINEYGTNVKNFLEYSFTFGYFPEGKYKTFAYFNRDCMLVFPDTVRSNQIEFEVTQITDEDKKVLLLQKDDQLDSILNFYNESVYVEEIFYNHVINKFSGNNNDELIKAHEFFFSTFPNSLRNFDLDFIFAYLWKLNNGGKDHELFTKLDQFNNRFSNLNSAAYLRSDFVKEQIKFRINKNR